MSRPLRMALIVLPWGLLAYVLWAHVLNWNVKGASMDHGLARQSFFADLAYEGCISREDVIAQAEARGWVWRELESFYWCHAPELSGWLDVQVDPPLPFSTVDENAAYIGFDGRGCMARWEYTICE